MSKLSKILVKICFCVWLANSMLPAVLAQYKPFEILFAMGWGISITVAVAAVISFFIPILSRKNQFVSNEIKSTLVLHDLDPETASMLFEDIPDVKFFCASKRMAACKGFYDCWLKNPGICALRDGTESLGRSIAECDKLIIVSKSLYGGFDRDMKNALDRSISALLPLFQVRNREQHHQPRYSKIGKMEVYIYNAEHISETDRVSVSEIAKANSINMNKSEPVMHFIHNLAALKCE